MTTKVQNRLQYIDQIKVFLTCLVVVHHAGQAYGDTGGSWLTNDEPHLGFLSTFFFFNAAYMMGCISLFQGILRRFR